MYVFLYECRRKQEFLSLKILTKPLTLPILILLNNVGTCSWVNTVCLLGLWRPAHNLAKTLLCEIPAEHLKLVCLNISALISSTIDAPIDKKNMRKPNYFEKINYVSVRISTLKMEK